jgi:hypothetical protein
MKMRGFPLSDLKKSIVVVLFILFFGFSVYENETLCGLRTAKFSREIFMKEILNEDEFDERRKLLENVCTTYRVRLLKNLLLFYHQIYLSYF